MADFQSPILDASSTSALFQQTMEKECKPGYERQFDDYSYKTATAHTKSDKALRRDCENILDQAEHQRLVRDRSALLGIWADENNMTKVDPIDVKIAVSAIRHSVQGIGTDEKTLLKTLAGKSPAMIQAMREEYKTQFQEDMEERIQSELKHIFSGKLDWEEAKGYLDGDPVPAAIAALRNALSGYRTSDDDKAKIFETLGRLTYAQRITLQEKTRESKLPLLDMLQKKLSGNDLELALALLSGNRGRAEAAKFAIAAEDGDKNGMLQVLRRASADERDKEHLDHEDLLIQAGELKSSPGLKHYIPEMEKNPYRLEERASGFTRSEMYRKQDGAIDLLKGAGWRFSGEERKEAQALIGTDFQHVYGAHPTIQLDREAAANAALEAARDKADSFRSTRKELWNEKNEAERHSDTLGPIDSLMLAHLPQTSEKELDMSPEVLEAKEQYGKLDAQGQADLAAIRLHGALHKAYGSAQEIFAALHVSDPKARLLIRAAYQSRYKSKSIEDEIQSRAGSWGGIKEQYDYDILRNLLGEHTPAK